MAMTHAASQKRSGGGGGGKRLAVWVTGTRRSRATSCDWLTVLFHADSMCDRCWDGHWKIRGQ